VIAIGLVSPPFGARRQVLQCLGVATLVSLGLFAPTALSVSLDDLAHLDLWPRDGRFPGLGPVDFVRDVGLLATFGMVVAAALGKRERWLWLPTGIVVLFDTLIPTSLGDTSLGSVEGCPARAALHLLTLASVAPLGAVGLRRLLDLGLGLGVLRAGQGAALLTVLALAVSTAGLEDAHRYLSQTDVSGARAWTSAALDDLPPGALVLARTEPVGRRLRAAQMQGERPDVLVLRLDRLARPRTLAHALAAEPALEPLIVDLSLGQPPSERALSVLVDKRAVYVEPGPGWEPRLLRHVEPALPLAAFSPYPLAPSDRLANVEQRRTRIERVLEATERGVRPDRATQAVLATGAQLVLAMLAEVGDERTGEALIAGDVRNVAVTTVASR
jgi:hypothetical protein